MKFLYSIFKWLLNFLRPFKYKSKRVRETQYIKELSETLNIPLGSTYYDEKFRYYPDLEDNDHIYEVEFGGGQKFYTAIGQSLTYAHLSGKQPAIIFILRKDKKGAYNELKKYTTHIIKDLLDKHKIKVSFYLEEDCYKGGLLKYEY